MAANEREFTLIGRFDDQITKKLKAINEELGKLNKPLAKDNVTKSLKGGFEAANKELKTLQEQLTQVGKFKMKFDKSGIQAATEEVKVLGKEIDSVAKTGFKFDKSGVTAAIEEVKALGDNINSVSRQGFEFDKSGIVAAQQEVNVLGDILKANALIQVGEGFANALTAGATSAVSILQQGMGFVGKQFGLAVSDQLEDLQARGSLYGALSKSGVFGPQSTEKEMSDNYRLTRSISRANEQAIGEVVRTSSVSTGVVTTLSRQMTDNLLPSLLKARGITSLKGKSRDEMDSLFGGKKGIGTELAGVYEKMATVIPNAGYAKQAAFGFTQAITGGTINRQLAIFENNPVLVDALKTIDGGIAATSDVGKRIVILKKALEIAAPTMMLDEMRTTLAGGLQAVQDTLTNPTVGILSLGADIANEGKKTLEQYKEGGANSAYTIKLNRVKRNIEENADKLILKGLLERTERAKYVSDQTKEAEQKLTDALENSDSPIEKISVAIAPVLQEFASLLNSFGNLFLGPVTEMMKVLNAPLAQLENTFAYLTTEVVAGKTTMGEALGRAVGELFKALANYFNPEKAGKIIGDGINTFFDDFMRGFKNEKFDGEKYMKIVMDSLRSIFMKLIFKEGDIMKGMTGLGDALAKVFLLLAAPAFVSALISGLVPVALMGMGGLMKAVFKKLTTKIVAEGAKGLGGTAAAAGEAKEAAQGGKGLFRFLKGFERVKVPEVPKVAEVLQPTIPGLGGTEVKAAVEYVQPNLLGFEEAVEAASKGTKGFAGFTKSFTEIGGKLMGGLKNVGTRFMGFFEGMAGKLSVFGSIIIAIISLFEGKGLAESLAQGAGPLIGAAIGEAVGFALIPVLGPLGPLLGGLIGGWIGSLKPVTDFFTGVFTGLGQIVGPLVNAFGQIFQSVWSIIKVLYSVSLVNLLINLATGGKSLTGTFSALRMGVLAVNIALFPLTATVDAINILLLAFKVGLLQLQAWIASIPGMGWVGNVEDIYRQLDQASSEFVKAANDIPRKTSWEVFSGANLDAAQSASAAAQSLDGVAKAATNSGSSFSNNKQYVDENGKKWGWATLNSQKIMVEWGSAAGTALKKVADGASSASQKLNNVPKVSGLTPTTGEMDWYNKKRLAPQAVVGALPKVSGLTPTTGEMDWYNKRRSTPQAPPAMPGRVPSSPQVAQTASNTNQINQKATAQLSVSQNILKTSEKTQTNTQTSNTSLQILVKAATFIGNKLSNVNLIHSAVSRIHALLSSGSLRVKTSINLPPGAVPTPPATKPGAIAPKNVKAKAFGESNPFTGNLGQAIDFEMANKPAGSHLVIANSSETIIPKDSPTAKIGEERVKAAAFGSDSPFMGNLGEAINFELNNKPAGSHLVIANSSETVIPAAGGFGGGMQGVIVAIWGAAQMTASSMARDMERTTATTVSHLGRGLDKLSSNTMSTLNRGFSRLERTTSTGQSQISQAINRSLVINSSQNQQILSAIRAAAAAAGGFGGGALGGIPGSLNAAASLASSMGLQLTSFKRSGPASDSYHNVGRAMDFSNGSGPTPQMMKFAQTMAARHGSSLTELIYTPLRYSIKHGRKVPPYAQAGHYNHVHVAYAGGPGNPALFPTQELAKQFEEKMIPPNLKVRSITTNSSEALGPVPSPAPVNVTVNPKIDVGMDQIGYSIRFGQEKITQALDRYLGITTRQNQQTLDAIRAAAAAGGFGGGLNVASGGQMGVGNMAAVARSVGFKGRGASVMGAIGMAESGGNPRAHNPVPPDNSYGLWQINMLGAMGPERRKAFGLSSNEQLYNPTVNAKAALSISGGGTNFKPWSTYTNGAYKKYMSPELGHVAYALGAGRPAFFPTLAAAKGWEAKMIPASMKVRSITTNSGEGSFGTGNTTINAPITIHQQPNQDAEQLASMVAIRIGMAVDELRNRA